MPLTRAASISGFADLVSSLGGDPVGLLGASSVPLTALEAPDSLVPLEACADLLERSAAELHCPDLGLRLAQSQGLHGLGSMALAIRHSETMGKAFTVARRFLALHNQGSTLSMEPDPYARRGVVALRHVWHLDAVAYPQAADKALANLHTVVAALADGDYGLRSIEISYRSPAPEASYRRVFGSVDVRTGRPVTALRVPTELLRRPITGAEPTLRAAALAYLDSTPEPQRLVVSDRTRSAIEALMGTGTLSVGTVVAALETPRRTLQRRLAEEGTTIAEIIDQARQDRARTLLADLSLSLADVAAMLDFDNQATLSRAGQRWWAMTPTAWRNQSKRDGRHTAP